jgi:hypothetical protein
MLALKIIASIVLLAVTLASPEALPFTGIMALGVWGLKK